MCVYIYMRLQISVLNKNQRMLHKSPKYRTGLWTLWRVHPSRMQTMRSWLKISLDMSLCLDARKTTTWKSWHSMENTSPICFYLKVPSWCLSYTHTRFSNSMSLVLFLGHPVCFFNQPGLFNDDLLKSTPWKVSRWKIVGLHLQSYHLLADFQMNCTPWNLT